MKNKNSTSLWSAWKILAWCRNAESNRGPTDYESVALPTELSRLLRFKLLPDEAEIILRNPNKIKIEQ
tara:strand:- start:199 stop:402 length:204 start_codon:yes stop_codon:yes gene_type:complete